MTRPKPPRLPELGGMTEAGFNRVVNTIQLRDFGVPVSRASERRYREWRASLPKTRNKKQRKAANVPRWTEEDIRKMHERSEAIEAFFELAKSVPVVNGPLASRVDLLKGGG